MEASGDGHGRGHKHQQVGQQSQQTGRAGRWRPMVELPGGAQLGQAGDDQVGQGGPGHAVGRGVDFQRLSACQDGRPQVHRSGYNDRRDQPDCQVSRRQPAGGKGDFGRWLVRIGELRRGRLKLRDQSGGAQGVVLTTDAGPLNVE